LEHAIVRIDKHDLTEFVRCIRHLEEQLDGVIVGYQLVR
jgi:hypothetical protein